MNAEKQFKVWERAFTPRQLATERQRWLVGIDSMELMEKWPYPVQQWYQEQVQHAVYHAEDVEDWQRFRVSLKGLTTHEKLLCLKNRWDSFNSSELSMLESCRIDNYIGALVRGGQLNRNYEVQR